MAQQKRLIGSGQFTRVWEGSEAGTIIAQSNCTAKVALVEMSRIEGDELPKCIPAFTETERSWRGEKFGRKIEYTGVLYEKLRAPIRQLNAKALEFYRWLSRNYLKTMPNFMSELKARKEQRECVYCEALEWLILHTYNYAMGADDIVIDFTRRNCAVGEGGMLIFLDLLVLRSDLRRGVNYANA